jgi:pimeloyl-ACP methyl ester carboxylesterase
MRRRMALAAATVAAVAGLVAAGLPTAGTAQTGRAARSAPAGDIVVEDVTIQVPHQAPVQAYVVRPAGNLKKSSAAGVLFLHWLGEINNDRGEYLTEAITLAGQGVVSVLPQGYFPWVPNPDGTTGDVTLVENQVAAMGKALDLLASERGVDKSRIALVGHDYGAMYGSILANSDHRVSVMVLEAPDALMGNWFAKFWLRLEGQERDDYLALFAGLDPVDNTARLGSHVLFQWAGEDVFIGQDVRDAYAASSPLAQVHLYEHADHELTDEARADRLAFLTAQLGL